jgi:hypothetical protein
VNGNANAVERLIVDAAHGLIMQLACTDIKTGEPIGVNPEYVMMLKAPGPNG